MFIFGDVTVIEFQIRYCVPNIIKIGSFFIEMWGFNDFQDGGHPPSCFLLVQKWVL